VPDFFCDSLDPGLTKTLRLTCGRGGRLVLGKRAWQKRGKKHDCKYDSHKASLPELHPSVKLQWSEQAIGMAR
jgi:hypothetical protein